MSHYGIIYCAYQMEDLVPHSLFSWTQSKNEQLGGHTFTICAVSVPFEGFNHGDAPLDRTRSLLGMAAHCEAIHAIVRDKPMKETDARGAALSWLIAQGVDTTIMVDADELWTFKEIEATLAFVEANPLVTWFRVPYRQLVFTPRQWLAEPFTPPRIHRVTAGGYTATGFWDDNGVLYRSVRFPDHLKRDTDLATLTVPQSAAWVSHATWLNDERSKRKIRYQLDGRGWPECSFRWDDARGLCFNEAYYAARGLPLPEVISAP